MNTRRDFIKQTGILAASAMLLPSFAHSMSAAKRSVGLQLYSLRDIIGKDITGILEKVAAIGYKEVETYGYSVKDGFWGLDVKTFGSLLKQNGLKAPSGHYGIDDFIRTGKTGQLQRDIEACKLIGGEYFTVPGAYVDSSKGVDGFKKTADSFNKAAELAKAGGLKFAYHNHDHEFRKVGDTNGYQVFLDETDKKLVHFELDLYWVVRSGNDPLKLFKENPGRFPMWHVKDMDKKNRNLNTEIGQGTVNFKSIFAEAKLAGVKHYFVEHETNYKPDQMGSIKTSFDYIKSELL